MLFGVSALCCISHSIINFYMKTVADQLPRLGKGDNFLLSFTCTCNYVVSV